MKHFELTKDEFDVAVYPACALVAAGSDAEGRLVGKAMDTLERAGKLEPMSLTEMRETGSVPLCAMTGTTARFAMEDAHFHAMLRQMERWAVKLAEGMARRIRAVRDRLEKEATPEPLPEPEPPPRESVPRYTEPQSQETTP